MTTTNLPAPVTELACLWLIDSTANSSIRCTRRGWSWKVGANATTRNDRIVRWGIGHPPQRLVPLRRSACRLKVLERWPNNGGLVIHRVDSESDYGWCTGVGRRIIADTGPSSTATWIRLLSADARSYRTATLWVDAELHPWIMRSGGQE
jgi:hypothetical protein